MQEVIVYALVALAAAYLAQRAYHRLKSGEGGNCPGCKGGCGKPEPPKLIQLERRVPKR